jgi:hypothetical protein
MKPEEWRNNIALKSGFIGSNSSWTNLSAVLSFRIRLFFRRVIPMVTGLPSCNKCKFVYKQKNIYEGATKGLFNFLTEFRPGLGPTEHCIQRVGHLGVKRTERKTDHSPPSDEGVPNAWRFIPRDIVAYSLKATTVESQQQAVPRQRPVNNRGMVFF